MTPWIAWLIAALCAAAFVALWSWEVRRTLTGRQSIVDSAASQVTAFRRRLAQTPADREAAAVLYRSESIYCQAIPRRVTRREQYVYNALRAQTRGER